MHQNTSATLRRAVSTLCLGVACLAGAPAAVRAQDTTAEGLEEIVVTAEKRESTEQKTPIAMSVFSSDVLEQNDVGNLADISAIAPSVSFAKEFAAAIVTIRGVSSRDATETGDPAVALNVDGFYFQRAIGLGDSIFDLERVEVLRGPQGTLYGRNATGGAMNFITAKPKKDFEASAAVSFGNYNAISTEGMLNIPLSDRVQMRASFATREHDGYRNNSPAQDGDDADAEAARLHLAFQPTDNFEGLLTAELVKLGGTGGVIAGVPLTDNPKDRNSEKWPLSLPSGYLDTTATSFRWNFQYHFGFADLTYLGGFRKLDYSNLLDLDGLESPALYFQQNENPKTWNHELRLSSNGDGPFLWQVGGFYFEEKNDLLTYFQSYDGSNTPANLFTFVYPDITMKSKAVFGQGTWKFTDAWSVEAGIRYTQDDKSREGYLDYGSGVLQQDASSDSSKTTYHAGLNWQLTDANLLYAKIDTGYKAGGFTDAAAYDPETITAYEIGAKNRFLDNSLQLNLSAYYYDYADQQINQFVGNQTFIRNAGKTEIYGLELEGSWLVGARTRIDGYVGYLHAEFKEFEIAGSEGNIDLAGNTPPQAPELSLNFGLEHTFEVGDGGLTARFQTHYEDSSYFTFFNTKAESQDSYTRSDLLLTYAPADEKWSVQGYVRNIEDEDVLTMASAQPLFGTYVFQFAEPRTYGVRLKVNWK
jgi:iron complex outermembrane receptor protein